MILCVSKTLLDLMLNRFSRGVLCKAYEASVRKQTILCSKSISVPIICKSCYFSVLSSNSCFHNLFDVRVPNTFVEKIRYRTSSCKDGNELTSSTTIVQDGLDVKELPIIVRKANDMDSVHGINKKRRPNENEKQNEYWEDYDDVDPLISINLDSCSTKEEVYRYLEVIHLKDVTPLNALGILDRITEFESPTDEETNAMSTSTDSFSHSAVLWKLSSVVCASNDVDMILVGLRTSFIGRFQPAICDMFVQECLRAVSEDKMDVEQVCDLIEILAENSPRSQIIENLWVNILHQSSNINESNLLTVYKVLPLLKTTQKVVLNALERRTSELFWKLTANHITSILKILVETKQEHRKLLMTLTKWININIHTVSENDLKGIVQSLSDLSFVDLSIQKAVDRYMKAKGTRLKNVALLKTISDYCIQFKWRSIPTLEAISNFVPANSDQILVKELESLVKVFGIVNHQPVNSFKFFEIVENLLLMKFSQFRPDMIIDIMMSCVYLKRYPLNFVQKIFSPFFLDRINTCLEQDDIQRTHSRLKLLDWALTLECLQYRGPLLPRNPFAKSLKRDARLVKMVASLHDVMAEILGGDDKFGSSVVLPRLPLSEMYIVDFVVHLNKKGIPMPYQKIGGIYKRIAIVIHLPDDYCLNEKHLVGVQATRIRHLQLLGFDVVQCDYSHLESLHLSPKERVEYLKEKILPSTKI